MANPQVRDRLALRKALAVPDISIIAKGQYVLTESLEAVRALLGESSLVAVDVGARGGIPKHWEPLTGVARFVAFEPDPVACAALEKHLAKRIPTDTFNAIPVALSGEGGPRTLYVTSTPSGSSLLSPDTSVMREFVDTDYIFPIREVEIATQSLRDALDIHNESRVDLIKLDVQGCELEILRGFGDGLDSVAVVELEAAMQEHYKDQPTFSEIHDFMLARGFELFDMRNHRTWPQRNGRTSGYQEEVFGVQQRSPSIAARLWEVDALYVQTTDDLSGKDDHAVRRIAACLCTYNYFADAYKLIESSEQAGILDRDASTLARAAIVQWHRSRPNRALYARNPLVKAARLVLRVARLDRQSHWSQYSWALYPDA